MLEALQCGLSWDLILKKREALKEAFRGFDPLTIATFGECDVTRIMATDGVIHSERKIRAVIKNARAYLAVAKEYGSFDRYLWGVYKGKDPLLQRAWDRDPPDRQWPIQGYQPGP
ncbi:DNA-3-methyladenine glycosylase I [Acidaminococcus intestini]|nr:DNA-3-methyladenine glycosylase I [Acidaminococcus intestini]